MLEVLLHFPHGPTILVKRLIRIERSEVLIVLLQLLQLVVHEALKLVDEPVAVACVCVFVYV